MSAMAWPHNIITSASALMLVFVFLLFLVPYSYSCPSRTASAVNAVDWRLERRRTRAPPRSAPGGEARNP
eukprot:scaffold29513_cov41-Prasinocladus_malaysianus.AAC.1